MAVTVTPGFTAAERGVIAAIYWQAFGGKLGRVLGPGPRALVYVALAARPDHALVARDATGRVLGVAGFRSATGSFVGPDRSALRLAYGRAGAAWRWAALWLMPTDVDNARFLTDGIAVARTHRGRGIGGALIAALAAEGQRRGHAELRLDVADGNDRARALYDRSGFVAVARRESLVAALLFGHRGSTVMVRPIGPPVSRTCR